MRNAAMPINVRNIVEGSGMRCTIPEEITEALMKVFVVWSAGMTASEMLITEWYCLVTGEARASSSSEFISVSPSEDFAMAGSAKEVAVAVRSCPWLDGSA